MRRVMIVDDEMLVRVGLKSIIDWEKNGYEIVGEANNGKEAMEMIPCCHPDIVLTDLIMEPVDGITLIAQEKQKHPEIDFIVLSNYNDYEHVREAMKKGAKDFLFKLTANGSDLLQVLGSLGQDTEAASHSLDADNRRLIKQRLGRLLVERTYEDENAILSDLAFVGVTTDYGKPYVVVMVCLANHGILKTMEGPEGLSFSSLSNMIEESAGESYPCDVFQVEKGVFFISMNVGREVLGLIQKDKLSVCFQRMETQVNQYFNLKVFGSCSAVKVGVSGFSQASKECKEISRFAFPLQKQHLLFSEDMGPQDDAFIVPSEFSFATWKTNLSTCNAEGCRAIITGMADFLQKDTPIRHSSFSVREHFHGMYRLFKTEGLLYGIDVDHYLDDQGQKLITAITMYDLLADIRDAFLSIVKQYLSEREEIAPGRINPKSAQAMVYIKTHLAEPLAVESVASRLNMSVSYFSHQFKKDTGMGFVGYLNRSRMEKAKELLSSTDEPVGLVGAEVGIGNQAYFSSLFKKTTGKTPGEYRGEVVQ